MTFFAKSVVFVGIGTICGVIFFALGSDAQVRLPDHPLSPASSDVQRHDSRITITPDHRWPHGVSYLSDVVYDGDGEAQAVQLAKQIVDAKTDTEKEKLKETLKERLNKQFDDRQKHHETEIAALESTIKKLKDMVSKRQEYKKEIIDEKTKQLEREAKGLGW